MNSWTWISPLGSLLEAALGAENLVELTLDPVADEREAAARHDGGRAGGDRGSGGQRARRRVRQPRDRTQAARDQRDRGPADRLEGEVDADLAARAGHR